MTNVPPVFGIDRLPEDKRWGTRSPESLADQRFRKWIAGAATDPHITLHLCDGCGLPFAFSKDGNLLGSTYHPEPRTYVSPIADNQTRYTYGGRAHRDCVGRDGSLIRTAP